VRPPAAAAPPPFANLAPVDASAIVSDADVARFADEGAIVLRNVFSAEWVEALRGAVEDNMASPGPLCDEHAAAAGTGGRFHDDQFLWMRHEAFRRYVLDSGAAAIAARALGSSSAHIFYDQLLVKEPGTSAPTPWHNDTSYWQVSGSQICSIWLALDTVPADTGVAYVKGSHKLGLRHRVTNFSGDAHSQRNTYADAASQRFDELPDVDAQVRAGRLELLKWDMEPGDILLFYSAAIHGAPGLPPNSTRRRRGYATRWCGDDVRFDARPGTMDKGWRAAGYDCGLKQGEPIACGLHPNVLAR
jgi:ectoine hydroxylase-related dioxygenase (phytanoyl-CoA dioxygenase family)